jgi:replicative DNA helicase
MPAISDLRESGSLEQDADMVILLHRESAYEKENPRAGEAVFKLLAKELRCRREAPLCPPRTP